MLRFIPHPLCVSARVKEEDSELGGLVIDEDSVPAALSSNGQPTAAETLAEGSAGPAPECASPAEGGAAEDPGRSFALLLKGQAEVFQVGAVCDVLGPHPFPVHTLHFCIALHFVHCSNEHDNYRAREIIALNCCGVRELRPGPGTWPAPVEVPSPWEGNGALWRGRPTVGRWSDFRRIGRCTKRAVFSLTVSTRLIGCKFGLI